MHLYLRSIIIFNLMLSAYCGVINFEYLQDIIKILPDSNLNLQCKEDFQRYLTETSNLTYWALQMYDATGKQPSGIFHGNIYSMGDFDQCLKVKSPDKTIQGQYCLAKFQIETNEHPWKEYHDEITIYRNGVENLQDQKGPQHFISMTFHYWGLCVPSSCTHTEIQEVLQNLRAIWSPKTNIKMMMTKNDCTVLKTFQLTVLEILILLPLIVLVAIVLWSSIKYSKEIIPECDPYKAKLQTIIQCFNVERNLHELFKSAETSLAYLDGLRALSALLVIFAHRIIFQMKFPLLNKISFMEMVFSYPNYLFYTVDTFFVIGGYLRAISINKKSENNENYSWWTDLKQKYLRVTPAYAACLAIHIALMPNIGSGPLWESVWQVEKETCQQSWIYNMLYLHNLINYDNLCMIHTWYLSADMHCFLLCTFFLHPLIKWSSKRKIIFISGVLLIVILIPFSISYFLQLSDILIYKDKDYKVYAYTRWIYMNSFSRLMPYILGFIFGHCFFNKRKTQINLSKSFIVLGWLIGITALCFSSIFKLRIIQRDFQYDRLEDSLYAGLHRGLWSIGIIWLIFTCHFGYSGPIGKILCANAWKPLCRISYSIYLIHFFVPFYDTARLRHSNSFDPFTTIHMYFGDLVTAIFLALLLYLIVEAPISNILKLFYLKREKRTNTDPKFTTTEKISYNTTKEKHI